MDRTPESRFRNYFRPHLVVGLVLVVAACSVSGLFAQVSGVKTTQIRPLVSGNNYRLLHAGDNTFRYDTRTGAVAQFMQTGSYSWHSVKENDVPPAGEYELAEVAGNSVIRVNLKTGTTWLLVRKNLLPELQKVVE